MLSFTLHRNTRNVTQTEVLLGDQHELLISLLGKDKSKYKAPFILPIGFSASASLECLFCSADVLKQSDLGRQLQQTAHILENRSSEPPSGLG